MIKLENFDNTSLSGITYGGHSGGKKGIIIDNEKWFLKYPKSTKSMEGVGISYTTSPLSEYIGSHIYKMLGIDVHETKLGIANEKVVVACKDFLNGSEIIIDYNSIKNYYDEIVTEKIENLSSTSVHSNTDLDEIMIVMNENYYFKEVPELRKRFWDMFVIDALIFNNDRNDNNWGLVLNRDTAELRLSPVYDNGASFYGKSSDEKMNSILLDEYKMKQSFYESSTSSFCKDGKTINPLRYIESMDNEDCNRAIMRIVPRINLEKIKELFDSIPSEFNGITILSEIQKEFYYKSLVYKYENVLKPVYEKLKNYQ